MLSLAKKVRPIRVSNAVAAGQTEINSTAVDMVNADGVMFVAAFGTLTSTAVTSAKLQVSANNSDWSDVDAAYDVSVADDQDNKLVVIECVRPRHRYVRLTVNRGTANAVLDSITAYVWGDRSEPTTYGSTVVGAAPTVVVSPAAA